MRKAAVKVLGSLGKGISLEQLITAHWKPDGKVREAAVKVLGAQGERVPVNALLPMLQDEDEYVRQATTKALGTQEERVPLDALLPMLQDINWMVRRTAIEILGKRVPLPALLPMLEDTVWMVRSAVIQALGKQIPIEKVLAVLKDEEAKVREEALPILKEVAPDTLSDLFSPAMAVLQGEIIGEPFVSLQLLFIAKTLGDLGLSIPTLLEKLTELLTWPFWQVRLKAIEAVEKIRRNIPDPAIQLLYNLRRNDPVRVVRDAADDALAEILSLETGIEDD